MPLFLFEQGQAKVNDHDYKGLILIHLKTVSVLLLFLLLVDEYIFPEDLSVGRLQGREHYSLLPLQNIFDIHTDTGQDFISQMA